jgi:Peptidase family M28
VEAIVHLSETIGPRPPCSEAEAAASEWVSARLSALGYDVSVEEFRSRQCYQTWFAAYIGVALLGALLIVYLPLIACVLGVVAFVLYSRDSEGRPLLKPRGDTSQNVIARGSDFPKIVVIAHVDSALSSLSFHPRLVGSIRASIRMLNISILVVVGLGAGAYVVEAGGELHDGLWIPAGLVAAYLLFALVIQLHARLRMSPVPGANDNASGVEVLLRVAESHPRDTWFVATGSEESGMIGIQDFLERHGPEVAGAWFLNIDNVGKGRLIAAEEEGALVPRTADPDMLRFAEAAGAEIGDYRALPTDATVLLARRQRALTLIALDDRGLPPNWHWRTDMIDRIDPAAVDAATTVAKKVVAARALQEAGT